MIKEIEEISIVNSIFLLCVVEILQCFTFRFGN